MTLLDDLETVRRRRPSVTVIGDYLLDGWWYGRAERLAREAPAPIVDLTERRYVPGGAANTAVNLAALGAKVRTVGVIGDDEAGRLLLALLQEAEVDVTRLRTVAHLHTTTKIRVSVEEHVLFRLDDTETAAWSEATQAQFIKDARAASRDSDAQLICDYGSGALNDAVVEALKGSTSPLRVVDAHDLRKWRALRPHAVTPNAAEAERVSGVSLGKGEGRVGRAKAQAEVLHARTGAEVVTVTLDRTGTLTLRPGAEPYRTHARPAPEKQASGAGDVFVAALTVARAAGLSWGAAADLAQNAADVAVNAEGTCVCSLEELQDWVGQQSRRVKSQHELAMAIDAHQRSGERIVFTNGCFDVLHRGHTSYLRQARELGDVLVVAVNSDSSVRRLKGPDRPINSALDRANVVADLAFVDYVTVFDEDSPRALIERFKPHVYVKGGDYTPEMLEETGIVRELGGEVVIVDYVKDHSTTELIHRMRSAADSEADRVRTKSSSR